MGLGYYITKSAAGGGRGVEILMQLYFVHNFIVLSC